MTAVEESTRASNLAHVDFSCGNFGRINTWMIISTFFWGRSGHKGPATGLFHHGWGIFITLGIEPGFSNLSSPRWCTMESEQILQAMKSAPFVIFAKTAPKSLDDFSMDEAFGYFYFNDVMQTFSGLAPSFLTSGRNAKTDFPEDYEAYFADDVDVARSKDFPNQPLTLQNPRHQKSIGSSLGVFVSPRVTPNRDLSSSFESLPGLPGSKFLKVNSWKHHVSKCIKSLTQNSHEVARRLEDEGRVRYRVQFQLLNFFFFCVGCVCREQEIDVIIYIIYIHGLQPARVICVFSLSQF